MNVAVVLVAGGQGTRLGAPEPKAFVLLDGEPLLGHALSRVLAVPDVAHVVVVAPQTHLDQARQVADASPRPDVVEVVAGGTDRTASVAAGMAVIPRDSGIVLVHDAARCLAPARLMARLVREVRNGHPAVVPGLAVSDTIKQVDPIGRVVATPDRDALRAIQTPQAFLREVLEHAHASGQSATDDAALVERMGGHVRVVDGDPRAMKVTTAHDLEVAAIFLREEQD